MPSAQPRSPQIQNLQLAALYLQSLNEVFDVHTVRYSTGYTFRLHPAIWILLFSITLVALFAVGREFCLTSNDGILPAALLVSMLSMLLILLFDLDRPIR